MPKRECPFDDDLSPQLKIHVGQRQYSNGVNKEREMKKVYEKTLNLLKKGGKEFQQKLALCHGDVKEILSTEKDSEDSGHKSALKQMIFNSKLQLQASDKDIDLLEQESCQACKTTAVQAYTRCFYCNDFKCPDCLKDCTKCLENFCAKCSLIVYDDGEHTECLACYR